jgi:hypothetical protein
MGNQRSASAIGLQRAFDLEASERNSASFARELIRGVSPGVQSASCAEGSSVPGEATPRDQCSWCVGVKVGRLGRAFGPASLVHGVWLIWDVCTYFWGMAKAREWQE